MSNFIIDTIKFLQDQTRENIVEVNDCKYFNNGSDISPIYDPRFSMIRGINSLQGLVDYLNENPDDLKDKEFFIIIENYRKVIVVSTPYGEFEQRDMITEVEHCSWYKLDGSERGALRAGIKTIIVAVNTCFAASTDKEYLLTLLSNIKVDDETLIEDDGMTQKVAVKTGITTIEQQAVKRALLLRPIVTFPEIEQPDINYMLRLKQRGNDVQVKLIPFEDTRWQLKTAEQVQEYLKENLSHPAVILR